MNSKKTASLCLPAVIYLIIAIISIISTVFYGQFELLALILQVVFIGLWTWLLNYICKRGYEGLSWFLLLLPYIIIMILLVVVGRAAYHMLNNPSLYMTVS
jgi:ABC-type uncharacterized transport system permease subunit